MPPWALSARRGVGRERAVVSRIAPRVVVIIGVAGVADAVVVIVGLARIGNERTVVCGIVDAVAIVVRINAIRLIVAVGVGRTASRVRRVRAAGQFVRIRLPALVVIGGIGRAQ